MEIFKRIKANEFFRSGIILWFLASNLFINIAIWILLLIFVRPIDSGIILHYNVYFGVDNIGKWSQAFIMPSIGLALFILNLILARFFYFNKEQTASYSLLLASLMVQVCLLVGSISLIIINY